MANALELLPILVEKNSGDIEKIISKVGVGTILAILPNVMNILNTIQEVQKKS